jgi:hypothetical protein
LSFGIDGANVFQGWNMVLHAKYKINMLPTWKAFIAWHIALIWQCKLYFISLLWSA